MSLAATTHCAILSQSYFGNKFLNGMVRRSLCKVLGSWAQWGSLLISKFASAAHPSLRLECLNGRVSENCVLCHMYIPATQSTWWRFLQVSFGLDWLYFVDSALRSWPKFEFGSDEQRKQYHWLTLIFEPLINEQHPYDMRTRSPTSKICPVLIYVRLRMALKKQNRYTMYK